MIDDEEALFRGVVADPFDLAPRLVYADWLEQRGDPRAEFIRIQCDPESLAAESSPAELVARATALLAAHGRRWNGAIHHRLNRDFPGAAPRGRRGVLNGWSYRRGFAEAVSMPIEAFVGGPSVLDRIGPVRYLRFPMRSFEEAEGGGIRNWAMTHVLTRQLAGSPRLARIEVLDLHANRMNDDDALILAGSPHLARLKVLDVSENELTERGIEALRSLPSLMTLHDVHNRHNRGIGQRRNPRVGGRFPWLAGTPSGRFLERGFQHPDA